MLVRVPSEDHLRRADFFLAERRSVRVGRVGLVGRGVTDVRSHDDEGRPSGLGGRLSVGLLERVHVVRVGNPQDVPAVSLESLLHVLVEGELRVPLDRDVIVVVEKIQLSEPQMTRERRRFRGDSLHEVAVAAKPPHPVIHDLLAGPVEAFREQPFRDRHADGVSESLAERSGRDLHARRVPALRVSRRGRAPLPEILDVVERNTVAGQKQNRVEQHRGVTVGQDEAVAVRPVRIGRVVSKPARPQRVGRGRKRHRRPRVARFRFLNRVHGKRPNRVDAELVELEIRARRRGFVPD